MKKEPEGIKIIAKNRKAFFEYHIEEKLEAGLVLSGSEVKSLRDGRGNLSDSYAVVKNGEAFLLHAHISPYPPAAGMNHEPKRARKLLLHGKEIVKLDDKLRRGGCTLIPLMLYFKKGRAKVEIGLAIGKKKYDKRAAIKKRETGREVAKALRRKNR
ncbi:MAG TPA: SsrA-binding protein SmpB [bacterium]|nr:SsrA-binding protein SmpB [bacterium]